jgi:hypothetical protein
LHHSGAMRRENAECCLKIEFIFFSPPSARASAWRGGVGGGGSFHERYSLKRPPPLIPPRRFAGGGKAEGVLCYLRSSKIIAAPFSAIIAVGVLVFPEVIVGITEASATRSPASP